MNKLKEIITMAIVANSTVKLYDDNHEVYSITEEQLGNLIDTLERNLNFLKLKVCKLGINYEKCSEHPLNELGCLMCEKYI